MDEGEQVAEVRVETRDGWYVLAPDEGARVWRIAVERGFVAARGKEGERLLLNLTLCDSLCEVTRAQLNREAAAAEQARENALLGRD